MDEHASALLSAVENRADCTFGSNRAVSACSAHLHAACIGSACPRAAQDLYSARVSAFAASNLHSSGVGAVCPLATQNLYAACVSAFTASNLHSSGVGAVCPLATQSLHTTAVGSSFAAKDVQPSTQFRAQPAIWRQLRRRQLRGRIPSA